MPGIRQPSNFSHLKTLDEQLERLGFDENNCPVILKYKRLVGENVVSQGLFYLDWLMDHQVEFKLLTMDRLGEAAGSKANKPVAGETASPRSTPRDRSFAEWLPVLPPHLTELLASLEDYVMSLGDDVQRKEPLLYLHLNPKDLEPLPALARDVSPQGHWGTGDLELSLTSLADLDVVEPLILMSYHG